MKTTKTRTRKPAPRKPARPASARPAPKPAARHEKKVKPAAPVQAEPAAPEPAPPGRRATHEDDIPGEAINGRHLARCLRYAADVTPKKGGEIYLTHDDEGRPLVSGHDLRRSHTGYLAEKAALVCDIAVPRDEIIELADILDGMSGPMVRVSACGEVIIHYGAAQPPHRHLLGARAITQHWQPPSQEGRSAARGPLRVSASAQRAAVKWPDAVVHEFQSRDGIAWFNVSDAETGMLLGRAVLAEDGRDLYAEDERQTEMPGARKVLAPAPLGPVSKAVDALKRAVPAGATLTVHTGGGSTTIRGEEELERPEEPSADDPPAAGPFPEPGELPVVFEVPEAIWNGLLETVRESLRVPAKVQVWWFTLTDRTASGSIDAESANAVAKILKAEGLRCESCEPGRRHGIDVDVWTVGRAPEKAAG